MNGIIHHGMPEAVYRAVPAISPSGAKHLARSPAHYRAAIDTPAEETAAQRTGRAAHYAVLEPDTFATRCVPAPEISKRSNAGKAAHEEFAAQHPGCTILTASEYATAEAISAAVRAHPLIPALLAGAEIESSLFWTNPETGAACKGRPDALRFYGDGGATVLDLKTTLDASPGAFARAVLNYGYHVQAAAYLEGLRTLGYEARDFIVIAVEKSPPYCCAIYRMPDAAIELGAKRWREACALFAECTERGEWPGYPADLRELQLPAWALSEFYQSTEQET